MEAMAATTKTETIIRQLEITEETALKHIINTNDIYIEAALQTCADRDDLQQLRDLIMIQQERIEGVEDHHWRDGAQSRLHLRWADFHWQWEDSWASLAEIDRGLQLANDVETRLELMRIQTNNYCMLGDGRVMGNLERLEEDLQNTIGLPQHLKGCLSQAIGRIRAVTENSEKGLKFIENGRRFCKQEPLLLALSFRSEASAALRKGRGFDPKRAIAAAERGIQVTEGRYYRIERQCRILVYFAKRGKPPEALVG